MEADVRNMLGKSRQSQRKLLPFSWHCPISQPSESFAGMGGLQLTLHVDKKVL